MLLERKDNHSSDAGADAGADARIVESSTLLKIGLGKH